MLLINIFLLLIFILGNLFISSHLYENIDDYVLVYNYLKKISKNSILLLFIYKNNKLSIKNMSKEKYRNRFMSTTNNKLEIEDLKNIDLSNLDKVTTKDLSGIYSYGLQNPDIIKDNSEYLEIMDILSKRLQMTEHKLQGGYKEVGEFRNIILLEDNMEIDKDIAQDIDLNEEYGIYDMLK